MQYTISDQEPGRIDAIYHSGYLTSQGDNGVYTGQATGDTSFGFPGRYTISYQAHGGVVFGPFDWTITRRGDVYDLHWSQDGQTVMRGFGIANTGQSIIVTYWSATRGGSLGCLPASPKADLLRY